MLATAIVKTVFQNDNLIAVDKPPCVLTTPARLKDDPRPCLGRDLQDSLKQRIFPVHRLDFEVSGIVLFALNPRAHALAQKWFERASVVKTYQAVSEEIPGHAPGDWIEWHSKLVRGKRRSFEAPHGQAALTRARLVDRNRRLWELQPVTGRPHQLRVEMAKHGCPIAGDVLYGARKAAGARGIALRAVELDLTNVSDRLGLPENLRASPLVWPGE